MATLPRALRVVRQGYDYRASSADPGVYARGAPGAHRDVIDAMSGHRSIDESTVATAVQAIANAAANSARRRG